MTHLKPENLIEDEDLRERIALLEDPGSQESILPKLPAIDVVIAVAGMAILCISVGIWGYGQ